jgi:hypothetical protein
LGALLDAAMPLLHYHTILILGQRDQLMTAADLRS